MSSGDLAISVRNLSKAYTIAHNAPKHTTMAEAIMHRVRSPFERADSKTFWALKDLSLEIKQGEVVGIIGRNGAGKSTFLKILSRITEPTSGRIDLYGRVGSLLEVGTGFHPELTGRENIFLNGSILGMRRSEIARQFDAIVDFSGVERFLDTPVKRYSSGMYVRLAFAVAAHLEPEILIVDEVLAVGDAAFQKKCLGKMGEVARTGRTVLFVSHNIPMITRLCPQCLLLRDGRSLAYGDTSTVVRIYASDGVSEANHCEREWSADRMPGDDLVRLKRVRAFSAGQQSGDALSIEHPIIIELTYVNLSSNSALPAFQLINEDGQILFASVANHARNVDTENARERIATCTIPGNFLAEGRFSVLAAICSYNPNHIHVYEPDAVGFQVVDQTEGDGVRGQVATAWPGLLRPMLDWEVTRAGGRN
jgi:lipopolysaccharide transport system ATP-binding protein